MKQVETRRRHRVAHVLPAEASAGGLQPNRTTRAATASTASRHSLQERLAFICSKQTQARTAGKQVWQTRTPQPLTSVQAGLLLAPHTWPAQHGMPRAMPGHCLPTGNHAHLAPLGGCTHPHTQGCTHPHTWHTWEAAHIVSIHTHGYHIQPMHIQMPCTTHRLLPACASKWPS